jgi:VWFA-related protein
VSTSHRFWPAWSAALLLIAAAPAASESHGVADTTEVVAVEVPVQVLKDNEPVRGLSAQDFELYDGRKKVDLTGFEVLDLGNQAPGAAKSRPIAARRHFLLLFDMAFSSPKALWKAHNAAIGLVDHLDPSDLVAVASYLPSSGAQLLLGFTSDRTQIRSALDILGMPQMMDRPKDPLRLVLADPGEAVMAGGPVEGGTNTAAPGTIGSGAAREARENAVILAPPPPNFMGALGALEKSHNDRVLAQKGVDAMTRALAELGRMMAAISGRKYVVFLSEGFDTSVLQGTANVDEQNEMAQQTESGVGAYFSDSDKRYGNTQAMNKAEAMLEEFRRADCVVESVDIGGLRDANSPEEQWAGGKDSLFNMAKSTGGDMYDNFNDLSAAMDQMLKKTSVTYVLTFQPEQLKKDGSFHKLRVELKNAPRGTRVVARPGYYAPRPFANRAPLERSLAASDMLLSDRQSGSISAAVLAAPFAGGGANSDKAYVPVLIEVDGKSLMAGMPAGGAMPTEIYVYALDADDRVRAFFSQTLGLDLGKVAPALQQSGFKFFGHLDLPPGDYTVRVLVRNGATGEIGSRTASLQVPAFGDAKPVLLPAFFPEPPGKWLLVREAAREGDRKVDYPFMVGDQPYIPASRPVLAPEQEAAMSLVGYHLQPGDLRATAHIVGADGHDAGEGVVRVIQRLPDGADGQARVKASFRPPQLAPGEYTLLVTVTDPAGVSQTSTTPFVISSGKEHS